MWREVNTVEISVPRVRLSSHRSYLLLPWERGQRMGWYIVSDLLNLFLLLMTSDDSQLTLFFLKKLSQLSRYSSIQKGLRVLSHTPQFPKYPKISPGSAFSGSEVWKER